ncbi:MAG: replication protein [Desulfotomaculaceae bacterium]
MANPQPDEFTRISNELFEAIILSNFKKRQLNIILLVIRLSYGCGRKYAVLRQADFKIIGIDKSDIKQELLLLAQSGVLTITGERIALNKDYDRWRIPRAQPGGPGEFKQILKRNLAEKTVGETLTGTVSKVGILPTAPADLVGKTPTILVGQVGETPTFASQVGKTPTTELVNHQPESWQNTNSEVGKSPTFQTPRAKSGKGSDGAERNIKETLKKSKEKQTCEYDTHFENFWTVYPRKVEKQRAYRCWKIRIREGLSEGLTTEDLVRDLVDAAKNYAGECQKQGTQQRYIKLAATFLGSDKPYMDWINSAQERQEDHPDTHQGKKKELIRSLYMS